MWLKIDQKSFFTSGCVATPTERPRTNIFGVPRNAASHPALPPAEAHAALGVGHDYPQHRAAYPRDGTPASRLCGVDWLGVGVPPRLDSSLYPATVSPAELNAAESPLPPLSSISNRWASCS